ncbi:hypothetical protein PtB15_11B110 [Puccinia triticina]|nr:hypothetical protein PtB15_11B110 [Puccinia triticina]
MDDMDLADGSTTRLPAKPDNEPPPSVLLAYLENFIANPSNRSPQGEVIVDPNSLGAILVMMNAESTRLKEMNRQMNQMSRMVETFNARLKALESGNAPKLADKHFQPHYSSIDDQVEAITAAGGAGAAISSDLNLALSMSLGVDPLFSNHECEAVGVLLAFKLTVQALQTQRLSNVFILTDNVGVLQRLGNCGAAKPGQTWWNTRQ